MEKVQQIFIIVAETVELHDKPYYLIGSLKGNDLLLAHKSVSRYHAAILVD
jgi:pSer/pThr/pTyr-binding forkhead associated (FHA) protein